MQGHKAVLTQISAKNYSYSMAAKDEQVVKSFFNNLEQELREIPPSNIWKYQETNLVDDPSVRKVINKKGTKCPERIQNS